MFKEAIQKMPRQFAPQSLYNMLGEFCFCFTIMRIKQYYCSFKQSEEAWIMVMHSVWVDTCEPALR